MTGVGEEGEGEDRAKGVGTDCAWLQQAEWLCFDIQLCPAALANNSSALKSVRSMCSNSKYFIA